MLFIIKTRETYHMVYQVEADRVEDALDIISSPNGVDYVRADVNTEPAQIEVKDIEQVLLMKAA